jgi:hypothetical protein
MPPNGVIVLIESWGQIGEHSIYRPLGPRVDIGRASHYECSGWSYNVRFRVGKEDLQAFIVVKGRPGAVRLDQTRQILASIEP